MIMIIIYIKYIKWPEDKNMNKAISKAETITDHCRFLLMEMGIGILHLQMQHIIDKIMDNFPHLANPNANQAEYAYNNIILKTLNEVYDSHSFHYASKSGLLNLKKNKHINRAEQLLFLQQLANRKYIRNHPSPLPKQFSLREGIQYLPAFQSKIQCYGVKPPISNHCVPIHPWIWRNQLKYNAYANSLPCIHHKNNWHASDDAFYLQDHQGAYLSFRPEFSVEDSNEINQLLISIDLPYDCYFLTTTNSYDIPINANEKLSVSLISSPFNIVGNNCILIPYQSLNHPFIKNQLYHSTSHLSTKIQKPLKLLEKEYPVKLDLYQLNPILIFENEKMTGIIYHHARLKNS